MIFDDEKKSISDFKYIVNMIYRDTDNELLYVVSRVCVYMSHIVAFVTRLLDKDVLGSEDTMPIHIRDAENMVENYHRNECVRMNTNTQRYY